MNERTHSLLEHVQDTACRFSDAAVDAAYGAGKWAGAKLHAARLRLQIAALEGRVKGCFAQIGEMLYATHTGTPTDSEALLSKLQEIDRLRADIAALQAPASAPRPAGACPTCRAPVYEGDVFCRECGGKL